MRFPWGQRASTFLFCISIILFLFCPNTTIGFNISQVLNKYEDCYSFNRLLSESQLADQINHSKPQVTILAFSNNETIVNERNPPSWKPQLNRHIIIGDCIQKFTLESLDPDKKNPYRFLKKDGYSTLSKNTKIHFQHGGTGPHFIDVRFEEYEGRRVKYQGQTFVKSFKHSINFGDYSIIVVNGLLYDQTQELKSESTKYDPRSVSTSQSSPPEEVDKGLNTPTAAMNAPTQAPPSSNKTTDNELPSYASFGTTPPHSPPYMSSPVAAAGRKRTFFGLLPGFIILALA